jgi:hypothetical protein
MRADKTKPRRRHIRLQNGAHPATPVRDPNKTSLFEVPFKPKLSALPWDRQSAVDPGDGAKASDHLRATNIAHCEKRPA